MIQVADIRRAMEELRQQGRQRVASLISEVGQLLKQYKVERGREGDRKKKKREINF